ncbi:hypothetical protein [Burkholderia oklahomensis]|uniref:hypothetical protein n=1 Tax=Burkholderia oklahomensis TaxID=342113 RepID=UPI001E5296C4|nr:hypothetical protein [Burkholderia oklahomensis]
MLVLLVVVVLDVPELVDVFEPFRPLRVLAPGAPPEPSEPPQPAVIRVTDAQSAALIKVRVLLGSAMVMYQPFLRERKVPRPPGRDGTLRAGQRCEHRRPAKSGVAGTAPRPEKKNGTAIAHSKRAVNGSIGRPLRFDPWRAGAPRSSAPKFTTTGQSADEMTT